MDENDYRKEKYYQVFTEEFNTNLLLFEKSRDWSDFIQVLQKLLKTLNDYPQFPCVPSKQQVAKHLAQCLHPSLPHGVHLKALDCYEVIFKRIGSDQLVSDLGLYSSGLFPLFQYANITVREAMLTLISAHYLPLGERLVPCLSGIILALLPGVEENGEFLDQCDALLNDIRKRLPVESIFFVCLWKAMLQNPSLRLNAVNFLLTTLKAAEREDKILFPDKDLVAAALLSGLRDKQCLVYKGTLTLMLRHFPLNKSFFSTKDAPRQLLESTLRLLLVKDPALVRDVYLLLCGPEQKDSSYFQEFTQSLLLSTLHSLLQQSVTSQDHCAPFQIIRELQEKCEIRQCTLQPLLLMMLSFAYNYREIDSSMENVRESFVRVPSSDLLIFVQSFFQNLQLPGVKLVDFLLTRLLGAGLDWKTNSTVDQPDSPVISVRHAAMAASISSLETLAHNSALVIPLLSLLLKLLNVERDLPEPLSIAFDDYYNRFRHSSHHHHRASTSESTRLTFPIATLEDAKVFDLASQVLLAFHATVKVSALEVEPAYLRLNIEWIRICKEKLDASVVIVPRPRVFGSRPPSNSFFTLQRALSHPTDVANATTLALALRNVLTLLSNDSSIGGEKKHSRRSGDEDNSSTTHSSRTSGFQSHAVANLSNSSSDASTKPASSSHQSLICDALWSLFEARHATLHHIAASLYLTHYSQIGQEMESLILAGMQSHQDQSLHIQRFALLWQLVCTIDIERRFRFPLTLLTHVIDLLVHPGHGLTARAWLTHSLSRINCIVDPILHSLLEINTTKDVITQQYLVRFDCDQTLRAFRAFDAIFSCEFSAFFKYLAYNKPPVHIKHGGSLGNSDKPCNSYLERIVLLSLPLLYGYSPSDGNPDSTDSTSVDDATAEFENKLLETQSCVVDFLSRLLPLVAGLDRSVAITLSTLMQCSIVEALSYSLHRSHTDSRLQSFTSQIQLLRLLRTILAVSSSSLCSEEDRVNASRGIVFSPLFVSTVLSGLLQPKYEHYNMRQYWLDLIASCLPHCRKTVLDYCARERSEFNTERAKFLKPVISCLGSLLMLNETMFDFCGSNDVIAVMNTLASIVSVIFDHRSSAQHSPELSLSREKKSHHHHQHHQPHSLQSPFKGKGIIPTLSLSGSNMNANQNGNTNGALISPHKSSSEQQQQQQQQQQSQNRLSVSPRHLHSSSPPNYNPTNLSPRSTSAVTPAPPETLGVTTAGPEMSNSSDLRAAHASNSSLHIARANRDDTLDDDTEEDASTSAALKDVGHFMTHLVGGFHWERAERRVKEEKESSHHGHEKEHAEDLESVRDLVAEVPALAGVLIQLWVSANEKATESKSSEQYQFFSQIGAHSTDSETNHFKALVKTAIGSLFSLLLKTAPTQVLRGLLQCEAHSWCMQGTQFSRSLAHSLALNKKRQNEKVSSSPTEVAGEFVDYYFFLEDSIHPDESRELIHSRIDEPSSEKVNDGESEPNGGKHSLAELAIEDRREYELKLLLTRLLESCSLDRFLVSATEIVKSDVSYSLQLVDMLVLHLKSSSGQFQSLLQLSQEDSGMEISRELSAGKSVWVQLIAFLDSLMVSPDPFTYFVMAYLIILYARQSHSIRKALRKKLQEVTVKLVDHLILFACDRFDDNPLFSYLAKETDPEELAMNALKLSTPSKLHATMSSSSSLGVDDFVLLDSPIGANLPGADSAAFADAFTFVRMSSTSRRRQADTMKPRARARECALSVLSSVPILIQLVWRPEERAEVTAMIAQSLLPLMVKDSTVYSMHSSLGAMHVFRYLCVLEARGDQTGVGRVMVGWQSEMLKIFYSSDFFIMHRVELQDWFFLLNHIMPRELPAFLNAFSHSLATRPALFSNKRKENHNRALQVWRLALIIFSGRFDQYSELYAVIQEKIVEAFRAVVEDEAVRLKEYVFLLLRVVVVRCTPKRADPLWPFILCEIVKIFEAKEAPLIMAATKLLDLMFLVSNEQFNLWTWMFIKDAAHAAKASNADYIPLIERLKPHEASDFYMPLPVVQRPLITGRPLYHAFLLYLSQYSTLVYCNVVSGTAVDLEYVNETLEAEFVEEDRRIV